MAGDRPTFLIDDDWARPLDALKRLKRLLVDVDFAVTARLPYPGGGADVLLEPANLRSWHAGGSNLFHRSAFAKAFRRRLARAHPKAVALHELLTLGRTIGTGDAAVLFGDDLLEQLRGARVLDAVEDGFRANVLAVESDGLLYLADPVRLQDHADYVYAGRSSFSAADFLSGVQWTPPSRDPQRPRCLLDLGCGAGFAAVAARAGGVEQVVGSDIVERCLRFGRLNAALNEVEELQFVRSDLFEDIVGDFDLIVSNAPCVWDQLQQAVFATGGGDFGTALPVRMISESLDRLRPDGLLIVIMSAPIVHGRAYVCDALARACGNRHIDVSIHPLISEYEYPHAGAYRQHGISQFVRYLAALRPRASGTIRLRRSQDLRFACYRSRAAAVRVVADLVAIGGARGREPARTS